MNFSLTLSLKNQALVRVAASLWKPEDANEFMTSPHSAPCLTFRDGNAKLKKVTEEVIKRVEGVPLPELIKGELKNVVKSVVLQIALWIHFHYDRCKLDIKIPSEFCWTVAGTIDKKRTAEFIMRTENLTVEERYRLACTYCLDEYIEPLWEQFKTLGKGNLINIRICEPPLVSFWSHYLEGKVAQLRTLFKKCCIISYDIPFELAFHVSSVSGNVAATNYFLKKLSPESKEAVIIKTVGCVGTFHCFIWDNLIDYLNEHYADVIRLLLSNMNDEQRNTAFKSFPFKILMCLLDWPWQDLFMPTARCVWDVLSKKEYANLLRSVIHHRIAVGPKDRNYQKILERFWLESPMEFRKYASKKAAFNDSLFSLFSAKDEINMRLILNDSCFQQEDKTRFFLHHGTHICFDLINGTDWDFLEFVFKQCLSSNEERMKFKQDFEGYLTARCDAGSLYFENWGKFTQRMDGFVAVNDGKRSAEDDNPTKRFCATLFANIGN